MTNDDKTFTAEDEAIRAEVQRGVNEDLADFFGTGTADESSRKLVITNVRKLKH